MKKKIFIIDIVKISIPLVAACFVSYFGFVRSVDSKLASIEASIDKETELRIQADVNLSNNQRVMENNINKRLDILIGMVSEFKRDIKVDLDRLSDKMDTKQDKDVTLLKLQKP